LAFCSHLAFLNLFGR